MIRVQNRKLRGSWWRWLLIFAGVCLAPVVILFLVALTYLGLEGNAASLRCSVMKASGAEWQCLVALNFGASTLGAVGYGLGWGQGAEVAEAQAALRAVKRASVGVYERSPDSSVVDPVAMIAAADRAMGSRGWQRLVGVRNHADTVIIYVPQQADDDEFDVCLAVMNGSQLIVVSTRLDAAGLATLVEAKLPAGLTDRLRFAPISARSL